MSCLLKAIVPRPLLAVVLGFRVSKRAILSCIGCDDVGCLKEKRRATC